MELDIRGKECPMTFVYTKVALESLEAGQVLKVMLDFPPAFTNVPNSVKAQKMGEIMDEIHCGSELILLIRKI
jgi:tRNA 2-thiouridine synthesizing protein A